MNRNDEEMPESARRVIESNQRIHKYCLRLKKSGFSDAELQRVIDPLDSFYLQIKEELKRRHMGW